MHGNSEVPIGTVPIGTEGTNIVLGGSYAES